jgi:hypothetical protein
MEGFDMGGIDSGARSLPSDVSMRPDHFTIWLLGYLQGLGNGLPTSAHVARIREMLDLALQTQLSPLAIGHKSVNILA